MYGFQRAFICTAFIYVGRGDARVESLREQVGEFLEPHNRPLKLAKRNPRGPTSAGIRNSAPPSAIKQPRKAVGTEQRDASLLVRMRMWMNRVDPVHIFRGLYRLDI